MRNQVGNSSTSELNSLDFAQLVLGLLAGDAVDGKATLGIVDQTEVLAGLLNANDIHEAGGVVEIVADLVVNLDEALHHNGVDLTTVEGILQTITEEDNERHALAELVRTWGRSGSVCAGEFVEQPMRRGRKALHMLFSGYC
jgi:hypothetical protein